MNRGITGRTPYPALASAAAILSLIACRGDMEAEQRLRDRHPAQAAESRVSRLREESRGEPGGRRVRERAGTPEEVRRREQMVASQLQARDIADPVVLAVMGRVPRHLYVPERRPSSRNRHRIRVPGSRPGGNRPGGLYHRDCAGAGTDGRGSVEPAGIREYPRAHRRRLFRLAARSSLRRHHRHRRARSRSPGSGRLTG